MVSIPDNQLRYNLALKRADKALSLETWSREVRQEAANSSLDATLLAQMADKLSMLLEYLGTASSPLAQSVRLWCLLYAVRPELINHETFQDAADRFGCAQENVIYHFARLKKLFPAFVPSDRHHARTDRAKARAIKANAARVAQQKKFKTERAAAFLARRDAA